MRPPPPESYLDGCTVGPKRFGKVSHYDVCQLHDLGWWYVRTFFGKIWEDLKWAGRIIWRHRYNFPYQPFAIAYALIGLLWLLTGGWIWWMGLVGPGRKLRK